MQEHIFDWLSLLGRWAHIVTGIAWIGSSFFFMWLDASLEKHDQLKEGVEGELFMVHGGGYYHVDKKVFGHGSLPKVLHWFKWEAAFTVITGYFLLGVIYYVGGATYMVDTSIADISGAQAILIGLGGLITSWFLYDIVWRTTGKMGLLPIILTTILVLAYVQLFTSFISGRAAYIHIGAMMGTWMVLNVWVHIIPNQKRMLESAQNNETPDYSLGDQAKYRSTHNNYFTLPVIFIMISNHHPATYGNDKSWAIVSLSFIAGAFIRHFFNLKNKKVAKRKWVFIPATLALLLTIYITAPEDIFSSDQETTQTLKHTHYKKVIPPAKQKKINAPEKKEVQLTESAQNIERTKIDSQLSNIKGVISFSGTIPKAKKLKLPAACAKQHKGPVYQNDVQVNQGKLKNAIIYISAGHENLEVPPAPTKEYEIDQRGCIYIPRISTVRAGTPVTFINSDPVFHNVKGVTKNNKRFNKGMPKKGQRMTKTFHKEEITVHAKCSLHPWMGAHIGVFSHPWYSVSQADGSFNIPNVPAGNYTITFWHEVFGEQTKNVSFAEGEEISLQITFK